SALELASLRPMVSVHPLRRQLFCLIATALASLSGFSLEVTNRFGFAGPEIFPVENQISPLRSVDLDGDGLRDIVGVNNARSKIPLLYNRTDETNEVSEEALSDNINELPPDARFRVESIASEKRISSLVVADLNNDSRPDIAYYGEPKELIV